MTMKSGTDDIHKLTEAVYKNLVENFNSGVRQILLTGKAYYKSLQMVSATAFAYSDALSRVGSMAKVCRGGTEDIGEAILQLAEAQKEIQTRFEDSTKALFSELVLPLEQKLEKDFKKANSDAKRYSQGHKDLISPYNKAYDTLKKFRKKTKNKLVYDNEKEAQHMRSLGKCQDKLDQYRIQGLKTALLEERRCHCFVLQRLCTITQINNQAHRHGVAMYASLPEWRDVCANSHILPPSAEQLIADYMQDEQYEPMNGGPGFYGNGFLHRDSRDAQSLGNGVRRSHSTHDIYRQANHFDPMKTLPPRTAAPVPPGSHVQAIYSFTAEVDNQLSFNEGDMIAIMGDKSDGWQYGQNVNSQKMGWFPLSFTKAASVSRGSPDFSPLHRTKSVGDMLDSRSLSEYTHQYEHDVPGNVRRPKSLYDGPPGPHHDHTASPPQAVGPLVPFNTIYGPTPTYSHYPTPALSHAECEQIYQPIYGHTDTTEQLHGMHTRRELPYQCAPSVYSSHGRPLPNTPPSAASIRGGAGEITIPPPPVTGAPSTGAQLHTKSHTLPSHSTTSVSRMSHMAPPPPRNPPPQAPPPPPLHPSRTSPKTKPPPIPPPPSQPAPTAKPVTKPPNVATTTTMSTLVSQQSPQRNSRLSSHSSGFGSPARQQSSQAPPPPPLYGQHQQADDKSTIEENVNYRDNPMFASVSLRQTKTNDRSAPKV